MISITDALSQSSPIYLNIDDKDRNILEFIERNIPPENLYTPWLNRAWPGLGLAGLTWPTGYKALPPVCCGRFRYPPRDASRWGYGHYLASGNITSQIAEIAFGEDGDEFNALTLTIDSPGLNSVEQFQINVYLFPPYPLVYTGSIESGINNPYLLSFVDQRYFWWNVPCPDFGITTPGSQTWQNLYNLIGSSLGLTVNNDTINTNYLDPSILINLTGEVLPPIFDAIARNCGQYVYINYSGNVYTQNFATAQTMMTADIAANPLRTTRAGGFRNVAI